MDPDGMLSHLSLPCSPPTSPSPGAGKGGGKLRAEGQVHRGGRERAGPADRRRGAARPHAQQNH
eukprot:5229131-Pyramimonas_sp.AAC.4